MGRKAAVRVVDDVHPLWVMGVTVANERPPRGHLPPLRTGTKCQIFSTSTLNLRMILSEPKVGAARTGTGSGVMRKAA